MREFGGGWGEDEKHANYWHYGHDFVEVYFKHQIVHFKDVKFSIYELHLKMVKNLPEMRETRVWSS